MTLLHVYSHADPRLLTPAGLKAEHRQVHQLIVLAQPGAELDFLLFRHELLRIAANARSGLKHSEFTTANQRAHPSPVAIDDLRVIDDRYARRLLVYERWNYLRKQRDVETINLLFHAFMKRAPCPQPAFFSDKTPWSGSTPGAYLAQHRQESNHVQEEVCTP